MASRVSLVRASTNTLEVCWVATPTAQAYVLEVQKIETATPAQTLAVNTSSVALVKKHQNINSQQMIGVGGGDNQTKELLLSPKVQTPTGIRLTSPPSAAAAVPISFGVASGQSAFATNAITSTVAASSISNVSLSQTGQPIIISSPVPTPALTPAVIVCTLFM